MTAVPIFAIAVILVAAAVLGFGVGNRSSEQQVTSILADIPQKNATLGFPKAPITLQVFADLECPTVKVFVESYLPSIIDEWVRTEVVKLEYRSLQTDTVEEQTFFRQEIAALAAGRQNKMWNFLMTFAHEQGEVYTDYATDEFLTDIAAQVPGLTEAQWRSDRADPLLSKRVALDVYSAHNDGLNSTPSFLLKFDKDDFPQTLNGAPTVKDEFVASLLSDVKSLREENARDRPTLKIQP